MEPPADRPDLRSDPQDRPKLTWERIYHRFKANGELVLLYRPSDRLQAR